MEQIKILSLSGGKDSMYLLTHFPDTYDVVVHFELEIDYPFIKDVIKWAKDFTVRHNKKFIVLKPRTSYNELLKKYDTPTRMCRWCNSMYKLDCAKQLKNLYNNYINVIGICKNEINRMKEGNIYPLKDINEEDILSNLPNEPYYKLYNGWYDEFKRQGCFCCPMMTRKELCYLKKNYPKLYNDYVFIPRLDWEKKYNKLYYGNKSTLQYDVEIDYQIEHPLANFRLKSTKEEITRIYNSILGVKKL